MEVRVERDGAVAVVTIDNPPMNVLGAPVVGGLLQAFAQLERETGVRAVVLCGAGTRAFVAGADIREFPALLARSGAAADFAANLHALMDTVDRFGRPVIAALHGHVLGGGMELALACDLRVADETVHLGLPEVKLGILPGAGGTQRLPRLIGAARAKWMMFTGEPIPATTAEQWGLVDTVTPPGKAVETAVALATTIAERSAQAVARIKRAVNAGLDLELSQGLALEMELFDDVFLTEDSREGIEAFLQKRPPRMNDR